MLNWHLLSITIIRGFCASDIQYIHEVCKYASVEFRTSCVHAVWAMTHEVMNSSYVCIHMHSVAVYQLREQRLPLLFQRPR